MFHLEATKVLELAMQTLVFNATICLTSTNI